ncbi:LysR family transcriptional regulator [Coralloluteibacterium thermophilus]|uniref:LysR family transcriptional regulator n=1 Tax=Coralloluteibacterium thermophilum TaxID=2707049 RepID=A0ABV9NGM2_9GAMM
MPVLDEIELFVRAAEAGSLSRGGRLLGVAPAAASAALKRLEARLGVRLMVRSTRSLRLTPEGETYLAHCRQALDALAAGRAALAAGEGVRGELRISAPSDLGRHLLRGWLDAFQRRHPGARVVLTLSDALSDLLREPIDIAVRLGELPDSGLVALRLPLLNPRVLCAAPAYLARHGAPDTPQALRGHNCLRYRLDGRSYGRWRFRRGDEVVDVEVEGDRQGNDGALVRAWAVDGFGIAYKSRLDVLDDLAAGRLVALLPDWQGESAPVSLLLPHRRHLSPAVRALADFLHACARRMEAGEGVPDASRGAGAVGEL